MQRLHLHATLLMMPITTRHSTSPQTPRSNLLFPGFVAADTWRHEDYIHAVVMLLNVCPWQEMERIKPKSYSPTELAAPTQCNGHHAYR